MANEILKFDQNSIRVLAGVTDDADQDIMMLRVDPITKRLLVKTDGSTGGIQSIVAGTNITVNSTDPANPIVSSLSDRYKTTSTTSNTISSTGTKTFTVDANLAYVTQQDVIVAHDSTNHMHGTVVSYSGTTLVVEIKHKTGSGTYSSWYINLDGISSTSDIPQSGSVTRSGSYINTITKGTTVYTLTRTGNYVTGITDGTYTWVINRDSNNRITDWTVV